MLLLAAPPQPLLLPANVPSRIESGRAFEIDTVTCADALTFIKTLPSGSVNCIVTSPPYFGLRDYGVEGQWGLEATPAEHVARMVEFFGEVRRALRDDGVLFLNYGDCYVTNVHSGSYGLNRSSGHVVDNIPQRGNGGLPEKNLLGMPWRVAFGLQDDGWILRSDIIWAKPNPMPESVTDRPTKAHEYVFLFSKSQRYWYDQEAVKEISKPESLSRALRGVSDSHKNINGAPGQPPHSMNQPRPNVRKQDQVGDRRYTGFNERWDAAPVPMANLRTVWNIPTESNGFAHFATFPQKLVERCILAGCPRDGIVLDPFIGSGTVALVARRLGRHYIGSELNPEYVKLAKSRLAEAYTLPMMLDI